MIPTKNDFQIGEEGDIILPCYHKDSAQTLEEVKKIFEYAEKLKELENKLGFRITNCSDDIDIIKKAFEDQEKLISTHAMVKITELSSLQQDSKKLKNLVELLEKIEQETRNELEENYRRWKKCEEGNDEYGLLMFGSKGDRLHSKLQIIQTILKEAGADD